MFKNSLIIYFIVIPVTFFSFDTVSINLEDVKTEKLIVCGQDLSAKVSAVHRIKCGTDTNSFAKLP